MIGGHVNKWKKIKKKKGNLVIIIIIILILIIPSNFIIQNYRKNKAEEIFDKGMEYYEEGNYRKSIEKWKIVHEEYKGTPVWGKATYNIGLSYMKLEDYDKAIPYFKDVLKSDKNDFKSEPFTYPTYRVYRHESCLRISECYEEIQNYAKALEYAYLARDKYEWVMFWEPDIEVESEGLEAKIARLNVLIKEKLYHNKLKYEFNLVYEITIKEEIEYQLYLPFPISENGSSIFFIDNIKEITGNPTYNLINTKDGTILNITCKGSCSVVINYRILVTNNISNYKIFNKFSLLDEEYDQEHPDWRVYSLVYCSFKEKESNNEIIFSAHCDWIIFLPEWEYISWEFYGIIENDGWNYIDTMVKRFSEEFDRKFGLRPTGGHFLEFDYERNILLIGLWNGLGLYYLDNDTYIIIDEEIYYIYSLAIDYKHDIYYYFNSTSGINEYYINTGTLIKNINHFPGEYNFRKLAYDEHTNSLLTNEFNQFKKVPFYDSKSNTLFIIDKNALEVYDYDNNTKKIIENITDEIIIDKFLFENIDIVYDCELNTVFLSFEYNRFLTDPEVDWRIIGYNLTTDEKMYINFSEFQTNPNVNDLSINNKHHELYISTNHGLYKYNITSHELQGLNIGYHSFGSYGYSFASLAYDFHNDILYISSPNDDLYYLYKYDRNNEIIKKVY